MPYLMISDGHALIGGQCGYAWFSGAICSLECDHFVHIILTAMYVQLLFVYCHTCMYCYVQSTKCCL